MSNELGKNFKISIFGESHGDCVGVVIDGCPSGLPINVDDIQKEVDKRKSGARALATARKEDDKIEFFSGVFNGRTTGAPICLMIWNKNIDSSEYEFTRNLMRPGHADFPAFIKYGGFNDFRGGGSFSGRLTAAFVMAGAIALKLLKTIGVEIVAHTTEIGGIKAKPVPFEEIQKNIATNEATCADLEAAQEMITRVEQVRLEGDSVGGVIEGIAKGVPIGLGEPTFDTIEGEISKAIFAIPAVKGVEFGTGFEAARMKGSENNDEFIIKDGKVTMATNNAGGILGGISSGTPVVVRVAIKPTPSILKEQKTVNIKDMEPSTIKVKGRHDCCIVPRAAAIVEAMMAVTLCDLAIRAQKIPRVIK